MRLVFNYSITKLLIYQIITNFSRACVLMVSQFRLFQHKNFLEEEWQSIS
jgi:hypothetical protein